jgi:hypothetical protein
VEHTLTYANCSQDAPEKNLIPFSFMAWQIQLENLPFPANLYLRKSYGFKNKNHGPVPENAGISLFKIH